MIRNGLGAMIFKEREEGIFKGMGGGKQWFPGLKLKFQNLYIY